MSTKSTDIKIWYKCNNHCYFCIQWNKRKKYKSKSLEEIKRLLHNEYQKWVRAVNFTGWEPTIYHTLIPSIEYAKKIWYFSIKIQSNWQNFSDLKFCINLIKAWANRFEPSIHWFKPKTHDFLVNFEWWWKKVVTWINNLKKLWQHVMINSVITKQNYKEIPKLAKLLIKLKVNSFQFAFPHIWGSAKRYSSMIVPTKTEIMSYIKEAMDIAREHWTKACTEAIPYCLMKWYEEHIQEQYQPDTSIFDAEYEMSSYNDYKINGWKSRRDKCRECLKYDVCEWPWKEYPDIFWWDEFVPILK